MTPAPRRAARFARLRACVALAVLHGVLVGVAPLADARTQPRPERAGAHLESEGGCARLHDHLLCLFCRLSESRPLPPALPHGNTVRPVAREDGGAPDAAAPTIRLSGPPVGSRAPPAA